jgi:hypothetical protein
MILINGGTPLIKTLFKTMIQECLEIFSDYINMNNMLKILFAVLYISYVRRNIDPD